MKGERFDGKAEAARCVLLLLLAGCGGRIYYAPPPHCAGEPTRFVCDSGHTYERWEESHGDYTWVVVDRDGVR